MSIMQDRNLVVAIDDVEEGLVRAVKRHARHKQVDLKGIALVNQHYSETRERNRDDSGLFKEVFCDFDDINNVAEALAPYRDKLLAVTCRQESSIESLRKVVPLVPELHTPSAESLLWATEKHLMRDKIRHYDKNLTPCYRYLSDYSKQEVKKIVDEMRFPVIVKPNGLAASILVMRCDTAPELDKALKHVFRVIRDIYERDQGRGDPGVLVEEMIQGDMYSTDAYVDPHGKVCCLPLVRVITAHSLGYEGFYSYRHIIPTDLTDKAVAEAFAATRKAIKALNLVATTTHVELFNSPEGWKIIEVGPRIGGYREDLYREAYGVDHYYNDLAVRMGVPPEMPTKLLKHAAGLNIYADAEGRIKSIKGLEEARSLPSVVYLEAHAKPGDYALFARNGGRLIVDGILSNADPVKLEDDVSRVRELVKVNLQESAA
jgi:hypothetical protein